MAVNLDLAILGLLTNGELHGYEVKRRLHELPGGVLRTSFGSLYPALGRLEGRGLVKVAEPAAPQPRTSVPLSGSLSGEAAIFRSRRAKASRSGRRKKVYAISDDGRDELRSLLLDNVEDDRTFLLQVAFCPNLTSDERLELFERRRDALATRRADPASSADADFYQRALLERYGDGLASDLAWLDRLIEHERTHARGAPS